MMVNSIHPGCIDTNFGKGEIPFLANKVTRGESYYSTSGIGWILRNGRFHMKAVWSLSKIQAISKSRATQKSLSCIKVTLLESVGKDARMKYMGSHIIIGFNCTKYCKFCGEKF